MRTYYRLVLIICPLFFIVFSSLAEHWRDKSQLLIYSPRYFGPSAFPIPEVRSGLLPAQYEFELRGEYHHYTGDKTKDVFIRAYLPVVRKRAAIEITYIPYEHYKMTPETRRERFAQETGQKYTGDVVISALFQFWRSKKWVDILGSFTIKTASGDRYVDARFTDAAAYWFDVNVGRELYALPEENLSVRVGGMFGFYCWMTNSLIHRQNDAKSFGGNITATWKNLKYEWQLAGFSGYENNGDKPLVIRNNLQYEYKKNVLSLRYNHGLRDNLYQTYSIGYIRKF